MARKTASKPATKPVAAEPEALFPDVAPPRRPKPPIAKAPAEPAATTTALKRPSPPRGHSRIAAVLGIAVVSLGVGGLLGARLLAPEAERAQPAATAKLSPHAEPAQSSALHPSAEEPRRAAEVSDSPRTVIAESSPLAAHPTALAEGSPAAGELAAAIKSLAAAARTHDRDGIDAAKDSLERLVTEDPLAALAAILGALRAEQDEQSLAVLSSLLLDDALAERPEVLSALTEMARQDELAARRATAARALGNLPGGDASRVELLTGLERGDTDPSVREAAATALGVVGDRSPGTVAAAAAKSLVDAIPSETDPRVRSMLLYAVRDTRDADVTNVLLNALANDPETAPRLAAADMLGDVAAAQRARVLDALAAQLTQESDPSLSATIVKSIVSTGRMAAIPVLQRAHGNSGSVQTLIDDYLAGLTSGEDDMNKLEAIKLARETARAR
jgi:hypothetical protein